MYQFFENLISERKKKKGRKIQRIISLALITAMLSTGIIPSGMTINSFAAGTELQLDTTAQSSFKSDSTLYTYYGETGYTNNHYGGHALFELEGLINNSTTLGYGIQITYGRNGIRALYKISDTYTDPTTIGSSDCVKYNTVNGGVQTDNGVEMRLTCSSPTGYTKYIFVDLDVYNNNSIDKYLNFGLWSDGYIDGTDSPDTIIDDNETKMVMYDANSMSTFILTRIDESIGCTGFTHLYGGNLGRAPEFPYFLAGDDESVHDGQPSDSAWSCGVPNLYLRPYEKKHCRMAFEVKTKTYYVSEAHGDNSYNGAITSPLRTIGKAIELIGSNKGFICIEDYEALADDIVIDDPNIDIKISSADFSFDRQPLTRESSGFMQTIKMPSDKKIVVNQGSLTFEDITLDGQGLTRSESCVAQNGGTIKFSTNTHFKNFKTTTDNTPSVFKSTSGSTEIAGLEIIECKSGKNSSAMELGVDTDINYVNTINDNKAISSNGSSEVPGNILLKTNKKLKVTGDLFEGSKESKIGVKLETNPALYNGEGDYTSDQEVIVAQAPSGSTDDCMFNKYFSADEALVNGSSISAGSSYLGNNMHTVMHQIGYSVTYEYVDVEGANIVGVSRSEEMYGPGSSISLDAPNGLNTTNYATLNNYELDSISCTNATLTIDNNPSSPTFGKITGSMPNSSIVVTYKYKIKQGRIKFHSNSNLQIEDFVGNVGTPVVGFFPAPTKRGYLFDGEDASGKQSGWYDNPSYTGSPASSLPATYEEIPKEYYAKYRPDPSVHSPLTIKYTNEDNTVIYGEEGSVEKSVEEVLDINSLAEIPGYIPRKLFSKTNPEKYIYGDGIEKTLSDGFNETAGKLTGFSGLMPGDNLELTIGYEVDPSATYSFKVVHKRPDGTVIPGGTSSDKHINEAIQASPLTTSGYVVTNKIISSGSEATNVSPIKFAVTGSFNNSTNVFQGFMPNQDVIIEYTYSLPENASVITKYSDYDSNDAINFKMLKQTDVKSTSEGSHIESEVLDIYGYEFSESNTTVTPPGSMSLVGNKYEGNAIDGSITLDINYTRKPNYFKTINFKECSEDLVPLIAYNIDDTNASDDLQIGSYPVLYYADVLINDGNADGSTYAWKWSKIKQAHLLPNITIEDDGYKFNNQWFIDADDDGKYTDGTDTMLTNDYQFEGDVAGSQPEVSVVPLIEKNMAKWAVVTFEAGDGGSITGGTQQKEFRSTDKWIDIASDIPDNTPNYGYTFDGWYKGSQKMTDNTYVTNSSIYTAKFVKKNYNQVKMPNAKVSIDQFGDAKVTVYDGSSNFRYVVTEEDGVTIVAKKNGSQTVAFTASDGIILNNKYKIYETSAEMASIPNVGESINPIMSECGDVKECYIPVVVNNYKIEFDASNITSASRDIAKLTINPSASGTSYGIEIDGVMTWLDGNGSSIVFEGLQVGTTYKIVTQKNGVTYDTNSTSVYIDNKGENVDTYTVAILGGNVVGGLDVQQVAKGASVSIEASSLPFASWEVLQGSVSLSNTTPATFTMPSSNVVIRAKRDKTLNTHKQGLSQEVVGDYDYKPYADISNDEYILGQLSSDEEDFLIENGFDINYKVRYEKSDVTQDEENMIKGNLDPEAGRAALALNVDINRYVEGYRVDPESGVFDPIPLTLTNPLFMHALTQVKPEMDRIQFNEDGTYFIKENQGDGGFDCEEFVNEDEEEIISTQSEIEDFEDEIKETEDDVEVESENVAKEDVLKDERQEVSEVEEKVDEVIDENEEEKIEEVTDDTKDTEEVHSFSETEFSEEGFILNKIAKSLSILASSFVNDVEIPTVIVLPDDDKGMKDYTLYDTIEGIEVPIVQVDAKTGIIKFNAKNGHRYVLGYNRIVTLTFKNNFPGPMPEDKKTQYIKRMVGEDINYEGEAGFYQLPSSYNVGLASYSNAMWTYNGQPDNPVHNDDKAYATMTLYAYYDTNADVADEAYNKLKDLLEIVKQMLDVNRFLTIAEYKTYEEAYKTAKAVFDDPISNLGAIIAAYPPLYDAYTVATNLITPRDEDYQASLKNPNTQQSSRKSYSSGGGGGGGGGASGGSIKGSGVSPTQQMGLAQPADVQIKYLAMGQASMQKRQDGEIAIVDTSGKPVYNAWAQAPDGSWYHANQFGLADTGWIKDANNIWYHTGTEGNNKGKMDTGWLCDTSIMGKPQFYFLGEKGALNTGWQDIAGEKYYFSTTDTPAQPLGSLVANTVTPDGYRVDGFGKIIEYVGGAK